MGIKHTKVSSVPDALDTSRVRPSDWNDDHVIDGDVDFGGFDITNAGNFAGDLMLDWVSPMQYGAVADGTSHPLSEFYGSLAAAQAAYSGAFHFITSLTQEMDYAACKAAANECFGGDTEILQGYIDVGTGTSALPNNQVYINDGEPDLVVDELIGFTLFGTYISSPGFVATSRIVSNTTRIITLADNLGLNDPPTGDSTYAIGFGEHGDNSQINKVLYFPAGTYMFEDDTLLIRNLRSGRIEGAGKLVTTLKANDIVLGFDGVWYTSISNMQLYLNGSTGTAALDIDGNVPGHPYDTRGVQGITLKDVFIYANGSTYAFAMCRQGTGNAQGSECVYINCHLNGASEACYHQDGFNALANQFMGGNFQDYTKHGIFVNAGTVSVYGTGFQSTHYYQQYVNDGWDISLDVDAGAFEGCPIYGCRTEGVRFLKCASGRADIRGCVGQPAVLTWFGGTSFDTAVEGREWIMVTAGDGVGTLMIATTAGTTAAGPTAPAWPDWGSGGVVVDGTVTWTEAGGPYFIDSDLGSIDFGTTVCRGGPPTQGLSADGGLTEVEGSSSVEASLIAGSQNCKNIASTTAGAVTIGMPFAEHFSAGRVVSVFRQDDFSNTASLYSEEGFLNKRNAFINDTITLPSHRGSTTWILRGEGGDGHGGLWVLQATTYLSMMTADTITDNADNELVEFAQASTGADNHVKITNADTTTPPKIEAAGTDTNIDLQLAGKGTGLVRYGVHSAVAAETVTGYITIKDEAGNPRKIAVLS